MRLKNNRFLLVLLLLLSLLVIAACGDDDEDDNGDGNGDDGGVSLTQDVNYGEGIFSARVPEGWTLDTTFAGSGGLFMASSTTANEALMSLINNEATAESLPSEGAVVLITFSEPIEGEFTTPREWLEFVNSQQDGMDNPEYSDVTYAGYSGARAAGSNSAVWPGDASVYQYDVALDVGNDLLMRAIMINFQDNNNMNATFDAILNTVAVDSQAMREEMGLSAIEDNGDNAEAPAQPAETTDDGEEAEAQPVEEATPADNE